MCGVAGCIGIDDTRTVELMLDAMPHRGPDDRGIHAYGQFVFGHIRLSIVDVVKGTSRFLPTTVKAVSFAMESIISTCNAPTAWACCSAWSYGFPFLIRT